MTTPASVYATSEDFAYQDQILQGVSRTFALTIPQLPKPLRDVVGNAYLLCRIADTIEDEPALSIDQKHKFSESFVDIVSGHQLSENFARDLGKVLSSSTTEREHDLIANTPRVIRITRGFNAVQVSALERCVRIMSRGMTEFQQNATLDGLNDLPHLDRYCYHVAGVVGEMLTELFCEYCAEMHDRRDELLELAVSFGQGLQMTNILMDIWDDRNRDACWLPRDIFLKAGFEIRNMRPGQDSPGFAEAMLELVAIASTHLANALQYTLIIPSRETGIRRHCLMALGMAVLTLRKIRANPNFSARQEVKISRYSVWAVVITSSVLARSNIVLKFLFKCFSRSLTATEKTS